MKKKNNQTKPRETVDFKMTKTKQNFIFGEFVNVAERRLIGFSSLPIHFLVDKITEKKLFIIYLALRNEYL